MYEPERDEEPLIPSIAAIHFRLGQLGREQRRLRTLFRIAMQAREERERFLPDGRPATVGETACAATK